MKNEIKKDNTNELLLVTKILSISTLFMFIIYLVNALERSMQKSFNVDVKMISEHFRFYYVLVVVIYCMYIAFQVINYRLSIKNNHKLRNFLKIELGLSIILSLLLLYILLAG